MRHSIEWAFIFVTLRTVSKSAIGGKVINFKMWGKDTEINVDSDKEICFISHFYLETRSPYMPMKYTLPA